MDAIAELSRNHDVKHIMGLGRVWAEILNADERFELVNFQTLSGPKGSMGVLHLYSSLILILLIIYFF